MLPPIQGQILPKPPWSAFSFDRVLQYYDGPRLLLQRNLSGQLFLAWWSDSDESADRWLYLPVSRARLRSILSGEMPDREALENPEDGDIFVVDIDVTNDSVVQTIMTNASALQDAMLPSQRVRLSIPMPEDFGDLPSREGAHLLNIRIQGDPSEQAERVSAKVLGQVLGDLQRLIDAIGHAQSGGLTTRGSIPNSIIQQTRLDPVSVYAGSFGVRLESNIQDDVFGQSLARSSLEGLFDLIDVGYEGSGLTTRLTQFKGRVAKNYIGFLTTIEDSVNEASLTWNPPGNAELRQTRITQESARNIKARIEAVTNEIKDSLTLEGTFIGGNTRTLRFEIEAFETRERFNGSIDRRAFSEVNRFPLRAPCRATLQPHLEVNTATGEERITYTLLSIGRI